MSRPVSLDDVIKKNEEAARPRFILKKQRKQKPPAPTVSAPAPAPKQPAPASSTLPKQAPEPPKKKSKFSFEWDAADDTLAGYAPLVTIDEKPLDLLKVETHWSTKPLDAMSARDWRILRDDYGITARGAPAEHPLRFWHEEKRIPEKVQATLRQLKYTEPTPVQRATIPQLLGDKDVVGVAETGSGKTLAFVVPMVAHLLRHDVSEPQNRPYAAVLAPTRELALQIAAETEKIASPLGLCILTVIGGHKYEEAVHAASAGVHIVVATPGRLVDSLERGIVLLDRCTYFAMDEADRMIDMGFEQPLQQILRHVPLGRTTAMFTATISPPVEKLTQAYLHNPSFLHVGLGDAVDTIDQRFEYLGEEMLEKPHVVTPEKLSRLIRVLDSRKGAAIVFANYRRVVELLADELTPRYGKVATVHGSKTQDAREAAVASFRSGQAPILVATDVAARGIDIPHVALVVNFHMSSKLDEYIHRIGRTGRAGQHGESVTFLDDGDKPVFLDLKKFLARAGKKVPDWLAKAVL